QEFAGEFRRYVREGYRKLVGGEEEPSLEYVPGVRLASRASEEEYAAAFRSILAECSDDERRAGSTLFGPHRAELYFSLNVRDLRKFASQGQHKTFLVALKIGEFFYLKERRGEPPIFLLDDIFSELDEHRSAHLLNFVSELSQTFITST